MRRKTVGGLVTAVVMLVPGVADGHTVRTASAEKALARQAGKAPVPAYTVASQARITAVRSDCRPAKRSGHHGHRTTCRISIRLTDYEDATKVARRTCGDASVQVRMSRSTRKVKVFWRTFEPTCRLTGRQPVPTTPASPAPPPVADGTEVPPAEIAPPVAPGGAPSTSAPPPPGAPSGPPPGALPSFAPQASTATAKRRSASTPAARSSFVPSRPAGAPFACTPWVVDPWYNRWWVYACFWHYSSAPPGAHIIGWETRYYEIWYWTGTGAAFWWSGTM